MPLMRRNTCNGPNKYVDHLMKDPNHTELGKLWVFDCFELKRNEIMNYTKAMISKMYHNKDLNLNMNFNWVSLSTCSPSFSFTSCCKCQSYSSFFNY